MGRRSKKKLARARRAIDMDDSHKEYSSWELSQEVKSHILRRVSEWKRKGGNYEDMVDVIAVEASIMAVERSIKEMEVASVLLKIENDVHGHVNVIKSRISKLNDLKEDLLDVKGIYDL